MPRLISAALILMICQGCVSSPGAPFGVSGISPGEAAPGERITLSGDGFGDGAGAVAVGGRGITILGWSPTRVVARLPDDLPAGAALVVLTTAEGRPTPGFPLQILGDGVRTPGRRSFDPLPDGGSTPVDAGPDPAGPDAGPDAGLSDGGVDLGIPDADLSLTARFTPDADGEGTVRLVTAPQQPPGQLVLNLIVPEGLGVWGLAFHLTYDPERLALRAITPEAEGVSVIAGRLAPGRLAAGRTVQRLQAFTLTFNLLTPGQSALRFPARNRALRRADNSELADVPWVGGVVEVRR